MCRKIGPNFFSPPSIISRSVQRRPRGKRGGAKHRRRPPTARATEHARAISRYHALEKQIARASDSDKDALLAEQQALGGLEVYQNQSTTGGAVLRGGESSKWCAKILMELWPFSRRIHLLDVGAIAGTAYAKWKHKFDVTSIDIQPRAPHVLPADFFDFPMPAREEERFDVIGLSLVINFVGDLAKRGDMLLHAHRYLRRGGYVYVVLPLPCLTNSRYMTHDHFARLVRATGYDVVRNEDSHRLTRWLLQESEPRAVISHDTDVSRAFWDGTVLAKRQLRPGAQRNNFCMLLSPA